jgi:hypothetical protein
MSGGRSWESRDPWLWTLPWGLVGKLCTRGVVTWSRPQPIARCLAAFDREKSNRSSPAEDLLARTLGNSNLNIWEW